MPANTTELRQQRARMWEEMRKKQDALLEKGEESAEDTQWFANAEVDIRKLETIIEREEFLQTKAADLAKTNGEVRQNGALVPHQENFRLNYPDFGRTVMATNEVLNVRTADFIQGWLRSMKPGNAIEQRHLDAAKWFNQTLEAREIVIPLTKDYRLVMKEHRNMSLTAASGGFTVPEGFMAALEEALLTFGGMRQVSDIIRTDSGNDLPWPTMNDTGNKGEIIAEATTFGTSVDPTFANVIFKAFKYSSKPIIVSNELLQDSAFDLATRIGEWLGIRIGRIQNDHFTTGAGTTLPKGITVAATLGKTAASMTTFTDVEVIDLLHSVDPAYRTNARWMMHDLVLAHIRKLKDVTSGQYLWQPGLQAGVPDRLLGYTYQINQSMPSAFTTGQKLLLFGDFSKYKIRDAAEVRLVRLNELFAQTDQIGFNAFLRSDGNLLDAGTHPVKWLALA